MEANYKIIGADGREYGPATLEEIQHWIQEGRVAGTTQVWCADLSTWSPASNYTEFKELLPQTTTPPPLTAGQSFMRPVGFWMRLGAYLVDLILIYLTSSFLASAMVSPTAMALVTKMQAQFATGNLPEPQDLVDLIKIFLLLASCYAAISFCYFCGMNGRFGATLGKMAVGARIVKMDGSPLGFGGAFWRYSAEIVSALTLGIGYLMIGFRQDKRGLHDLIAKTRVIYTR